MTDADFSLAYHARRAALDASMTDTTRCPICAGRGAARTIPAGRSSIIWATCAKCSGTGHLIQTGEWLVDPAELDLIRAAAPPPTAATPMPARALRPLQAPCGLRAHIGW